MDAAAVAKIEGRVRLLEGQNAHLQARLAALEGPSAAAFDEAGQLQPLSRHPIDGKALGAAIRTVNAHLSPLGIKVVIGRISDEGVSLLAGSIT